MAPPKKGKKKSTAKESPLIKAREVVGKVLKDDDPTVTIDPSQAKQSRPHVPSGSLILDYLIGGVPNRFGVPPCPGWPKGAISQIYGHESSGKTTVALEAAVRVCNAGGTVCMIDWEHAVDLNYARALGVPVDRPDLFYLVQPNTLEAGLKVLWTTAASGVALIILDSVGAGIPEEIFKQKLEDQGSLGRLGLVAAKWSIFLPKVAALVSDSGSHVMGLSQLRKKINTTGYGGDGTAPQGGEAWKFYASIRMKFQRIKSERGKVYDAVSHSMVDQVVSNIIKAKMDKSKVSQSQQHEANFYVVFGEGIDDLRSAVDICVAHGSIKKGGAWFTFERKGQQAIKSQGFDNFKSDLLSTRGAAKEVFTLAVKHLTEGTGDLSSLSNVEPELDLDAIMSEAKDVDINALMEEGEDKDSGEPADK